MQMNNIELDVKTRCIEENKTQARERLSMRL